MVQGDGTECLHDTSFVQALHTSSHILTLSFMGSHYAAVSSITHHSLAAGSEWVQCVAQGQFCAQTGEASVQTADLRGVPKIALKHSLS